MYMHTTGKHSGTYTLELANTLSQVCNHKGLSCTHMALHTLELNFEGCGRACLNVAIMTSKCRSKVVNSNMVARTSF